MKVKRRDIKEAMREKFASLVHNRFSLDDVLYILHTINDVIDELLWEDKRKKSSREFRESRRNERTQY